MPSMRELQEEAPSFAFEDAEFDDCILVGQVRDTRLLFADRRELRSLDKGEIDNEVTQI
jgi:hypothetical protein